MMAGCDRFRDLLGPYLEGTLAPGEITDVERHLESCSACQGLTETLRDILDLGKSLDGLDPPPQLETEISDTPCRRWLGLLFSAIDRDISETNLDRLFRHLDDCPSCRRAWVDFSLIHQLGERLNPPDHLLHRCLRPRKAYSSRKVLGRRTATAAAYSLAILASLAIGNPVSLSRYENSTAVRQVNTMVKNGISQAADTGRSEARIMLWRALNFGRRAVDSAQAAWSRWNDEPRDDDTTNDTSKENRS